MRRVYLTCARCKKAEYVTRKKDTVEEWENGWMTEKRFPPARPGTVAFVDPEYFHFCAACAPDWTITPWTENEPYRIRRR